MRGVLARDGLEEVLRIEGCLVNGMFLFFLYGGCGMDEVRKKERLI